MTLFAVAVARIAFTFLFSDICRYISATEPISWMIRFFTMYLISIFNVMFDAALTMPPKKKKKKKKKKEKTKEFAEVGVKVSQTVEYLSSQAG